MNKTLPILFFAALIMLALAAFHHPAWSQDQPADNMQLVREKIRADKKLLIAENLMLTESEASRFWPIYDRFQQDLATLEDRTRKLIDDFAVNFAAMDDMNAKNLLDEHMRIKSDRVKLLQSYLPKFRTALPERKVARYYQIEHKIHAVIAYELARRIPLIQ
jgi:hypothetical protein